MTSIHTPRRAVGLIAVVLGCGFAGPAVVQAAPITQQFGPVNGEQTFTVPANVTSIYVDAIGGSGGSDGPHESGGTGGTATADLTVTPGEVLYIEVGGNGGAPSTTPGSGGFNGGGAGGDGFMADTHPAAGGGGASDVQTTSAMVGTPTLNALLVVAGGGGGAAADVAGGAGGGTDGAPSPSGDVNDDGGGGGTQTTGGAGVPTDAVTAGTFGQGGPGQTGGGNGGGGGGGGGLYGGGGGISLDGGGGGSGYFGAGTSDGAFGVAASGTAPSVTLTYVVNPTITVTTPTAGATYTENEPVDAAYTCDPAPGTTPISCQSADAPGTPIDTSSVGQHTFTVTATDADAADGGGSATATVTYTVEAAPTATITAPVRGGMYSQNSVLDAAYGCAAASTTTISSCTGTVAPGAPIDTSTIGGHNFSVTATDATGNSTTSTVPYVVIAAPTIQLTTPANGAVYTQNMVVDASYGCTSDAAVTCSGTVPNATAIDTATTGSHSFTVTAHDAAGGSATQTISYTVVASGASGGSGGTTGGSGGTTGGSGGTTGGSGGSTGGSGTSGSGGTGPSGTSEHIALLTKSARLTAHNRFQFTLHTSPPDGGTITLHYVHTVTVRRGHRLVRKRVTSSFGAAFTAGRNGTATVTLTLPRSLRSHFRPLTFSVTATAGSGRVTGSLRLKPAAAKPKR